MLDMSKYVYEKFGGLTQNFVDSSWSEYFFCFAPLLPPTARMRTVVCLAKMVSSSRL